MLYIVSRLDKCLYGTCREDEAEGRLFVTKLRLEALAARNPWCRDYAEATLKCGFEALTMQELDREAGRFQMSFVPCEITEEEYVHMLGAIPHTKCGKGLEMEDDPLPLKRGLLAGDVPEVKLNYAMQWYEEDGHYYYGVADRRDESTWLPARLTEFRRRQAAGRDGGG